MDTTMIKTVIAQRVEHDREAIGLTRLALSQATGIPYTTLGRKLAGHAEFTISELASIGGQLNIGFASWLDDIATETAA